MFGVHLVVRFGFGPAKLLVVFVVAHRIDGPSVFEVIPVPYIAIRSSEVLFAARAYLSVKYTHVVRFSIGPVKSLMVIIWAHTIDGSVYSEVIPVVSIAIRSSEVFIAGRAYVAKINTRPQEIFFRIPA